MYIYIYIYIYIWGGVPQVLPLSLGHVSPGGEARRAAGRLDVVSALCQVELAESAESAGRKRERAGMKMGSRDRGARSPLLPVLCLPWRNAKGIGVLFDGFGRRIDGESWSTW